LESYGKVYQGSVTPPDPGPPPADNVFVWVEGNAEYLDPNLVSETAGTLIASQMFEGLYVNAPGNTSVRPSMASSHEVSEDGLVYTIMLRQGLQWSDGHGLTAHDFAYSWLRALNPATGSKNAQQLWCIVGAEAYNAGRSTRPESVGVRVIDEHTLEVTLDSPTPYFTELLAYIAFAPVPRHAVERFGASWTRPENIVVNGPYRMTSLVPRDRLVLKKNPRFWAADTVKIPESVVLFSDSEEHNLRLYKSGRAHWVRPIAEDKVIDMITSGRSDLHIDQQMCTYYYVMQLNAPPMNDIRVRRAVNMAIDKERLTRHILASRQVPADHLVSPMFESTLGYVSPPGDSFDPEAAQALLADAGYPGGAGLPPIKLIYNTFEVHRRIAEFVQRSLKENLGVEVEVNNMEWKSLLKVVHGGNFEIARTSWCADYADPMTFLTVFHSAGEANYPGYDNPHYDALLAKIGKTTETRERNVLMCVAEQIINRDLPIIPFYFYTRSYLLKPYVQGFEAQYRDQHLIRYMSFKH